jgi:hypothetical protein
LQDHRCAGGQRTALEGTPTALIDTIQQEWINGEVAMSRLVSCTSWLLALALTACITSGLPKLPTDFLIPQNKLTAEEGTRLFEEGERRSEESARRLAEADRLLEASKGAREEAGRIQVEADLLQSRARSAMRAAAMSEEAERLRRQAESMREEFYRESE